ncbi:MAG: TAXI family TRAP transporter solute-binding subunit [Burkholderiales bacterium]|nr:TAXI family TRAP transporter solute-binding subunit [Burkholderiales bacterium]
MKALLLALTLLAASAQAQTLSTYRLATATPGGGFQVFGNALAEAVAATNTNVRIAPQATAGSAENFGLLLERKVELALIQGDAAYQAFAERPEVARDLAVLWVTYPGPGAFMVKADSPYRTIADLKGKRIAWGTRATGLRLLARDVMQGIGLDTEKDFVSIILERAADGPKLVLNGEADALWGGGIGWPGFETLANSPGGARFIAPSTEDIASIRRAKLALRAMEIPAGSYKGQTEAVKSVGLWSVIMVRRDTPDAEVTKLVTALRGAETELAKRLPQAAFATAANTLREADAARLHPAVKPLLERLTITK